LAQEVQHLGDTSGIGAPPHGSPWIIGCDGGLGVDGGIYQLQGSSWVKQPGSASRTIDVPAQDIAGKSDWGIHQTRGAVDKMRNSACTHMAGFHLIDGAGHWVQQEQPGLVSALLVQFLRDHAKL
jgi:pimeloyl-ACP methyl ester carboxylesterase